ncbi:MAG: rRNA maturation RNase YbeY [Acidobacteriaceae bacterium]|jgi:probable rRNA maturation factor
MISLEAAAGETKAGEGKAGSSKAWERVGLSAAGLARFLGRARRAAGVAGEVDVLLAGDRTLRRLNREFGGKDKATDVLSFPAGASAVFFGGRELAGDLAISLETAGRQARVQGHTLEEEVKVLLLHGVLHLAGMDHETDEGEMEVREGELRQELGLGGGLIGRVVGGKDKQRQRGNAGILSFAQNDKRKTRAKANAEAKAKAKAKAKTSTKANAGVLRCAQDDELKAPRPAAIKPRRGWGTRAKRRVGK